MEGAVIEDGAVTLADGSRVAIAQGGRVRVVTVREDAVELALDVGEVDLAVPHGRRTLVVHTPRYDVVDVGTRFRVALDAQGEVRVDVSEGSVEVRSRDGGHPARRLDAGESWSNAPAPTAPPSSSSAMALVTEPMNDPAPAPSGASGRDASASPKELLETAERARLAGNARTAAAALDTLRRRFRSDPRAALAAFELGRLRLDSLGDAPGAVEALNDAVRLFPAGPAPRRRRGARRVEALAAERSPECASAQKCVPPFVIRAACTRPSSPGRCPAE